LQQVLHVRKAADIKCWLMQWMDAWEEGKFDMLIEATENEMK